MFLLHGTKLLQLVTNENKVTFKLQAAMEGTSHPGLPPTGGFRKTGNGEQYAFKKANIEEYVSHLYVPNLLSAGGTMSITEH